MVIIFVRKFYVYLVAKPSSEIKCCASQEFSVFFSTLSPLVATIVVNQQWRSQNAEKVTYIKGRLLDQAVILFN